VRHGDALGHAGALGDGDTVGDGDASGDGGTLGHVDADGSLDSARGLDRDAPALPPGDWLANRGDGVGDSNSRRSNSNRCNSKWSNRCRCNSMANSNRGNSMADSNRGNSMADSNRGNRVGDRDCAKGSSNWGNWSGNRSKSADSVASRGSSVVSRAELSKELGIGISIGLSLSITLDKARSSDGSQERSGCVSDDVGSNMRF